MKLPYKKAESLACLILILTSGFVGLLLSPEVRATTAVISLTPASGSVGTVMQLVANITTANGTFQVLWDNSLLLSNASAVGNSVNVSLRVPPAMSGSHNVTIIDVEAKGENATTSFQVLTAYSLSVFPTLTPPAQMQESDSFQVSLNMTGGNQGETANITVVAPNNASYASLGNIPTGNDGNGTLVVNYPADFSSGANTNFTGQYAIFFNGTTATASSFIGLTNSSEYHRDQTIDVKAIYTPSETVNMSITGTNLNYSTNLTADGVGMVHYVNSTILSNASIGVYTVNVTSLSGPTQKVPPDVQTFTVPGLAVNITARNLAREPVPNVLVTVFENLNLVSSVTSDVNGSTTMHLEVGNYLVNASFSGQEIGRLAIGVSEANTQFDLYCNLTDLKVVVVDEDGVLIPDVELSLVQENQTSTVSLPSTDVNGMSIMPSQLPIFNNAPVYFSLNASRYGMLFNTTAFLQLPVAAWFNVTIICPKVSLQVNVTDGSGRPIRNANVDALEEAGGLFYSNTTLADGTVALHCTFGRYILKVYANGIELNETTLDLNTTTVNATINCELYDLDVSVRVSDYFGQSIPDLNVTLQWIGYPNWTSIVSGSDGLAVFKSIVGGDLTLTVRFTGQSDRLAVTTAYVGNSTTIQIGLGNYLILAGMLVDMGEFVTVIIIVLAVVFIVCLEVYRRRRSKPQQDES